MSSMKPPPRPSELENLKQLYRLYTNDFKSDELGRLPEETRDAYRLFTADMDRREWEKRSAAQKISATMRSFFLGLTLRMSPLRRFLYLLSLLCFGAGFVGHWFYTVAAFVLVNFVLILEIADKLLLKGDLQIAREIQSGLLPSGTFQLNDRIRVHARSTPANTVGGDYFDFIKLREGSVGIAVGDVSGKGIPAALLMAYLQASFRALSSVPEFSLSQLMTRVNDHIYRNTPSNRLITFFFCVLDTQGGLRFSNAGHNYPLLLKRGGGVLRLEEGGLPLGINEGAEYPVAQVQVEPGDRLVLYTDGITEATNPAGEEFGEQRLLSVLQRHPTQPPEALADELMQAVGRFVGNNRFADDLTLVIVGF